MRFRIMGPVEVWSAPDGWAAIGASKWRSLLACLLARRGELISTESLIFELWGDSPPAKANNLVSIYVHRLRRLIGDTEGRVLVYRAPGYQLRIGAGGLDLDEFEALVAEGTSALAADDPVRAATLLDEALRLWRGPLFADVTETTLIATEAERTHEMRLTATELRIEAALAAGKAAQVIAELRRLVAENPIREGLWLLLMRALDESGRHAEALDTYTQARQVISDELGVDPGAELQRLYARLLAADASSAPPRKRPRPAGPPRGARPIGATLGSGNDADVAGALDTGLAGAADDSRDAGAAAAEMPGSISIGMIADAAAEPAVPGAAAAGPAIADLAVTAAAGLPVPHPAQLPADIGDFTGRDAQVTLLSGMLVQGAGTSNPGAVRMAVVAGAAGLGKTTLAVHAAHQVSEHFPDGQLYVDLRGASAQAAAPGEVLARFLRDLGIDGDKVPVGDDERAALYRTRLTGQRVLILLDNARDAAQVRPLLPGSASCAVLMTTRNRTPDLASTKFVDLNVLEDTEALTLFSRIVDDDRPAAEPDATAEVLLACAGLPLAIRICAARLAARRQWRVATLASRLRDEHRRLDELTTGDLAVRASFQVSYDSLRAGRHGIDPAHGFRLLGLWQGASISLPAAAALLGESESDVADALETLVDANLLESPAADWYRFHDLLRFYATERAREEESEQARDEAVGRLLRWYLAAVSAAADIVSPHRYRLASDADEQPSPAVDFGSVEQALAWYDDERANLVAATRQASGSGLHDVAWRMPPTLFPVLNRRSNWVDAVIMLRVALDSARAVGDRPGEAWVLNQLGFSLARLRDEESFGCLEQALGIRRQLGDAAGEAQTAIALGEGYLNVHGPAAALDYFQRALDLLEPTGQNSLHGVALNNLGEVHLELGHLAEAADCFERALVIFTAVNAEYGLGFALHNLGRVYLDLDRVDDAVDRLQQALDVHRATGDQLSQALTLKYLGRANQALRRVERAREEWTAALAIFESLKEDAQIADIHLALASLDALFPAGRGASPRGSTVG